MGTLTGTKGRWLAGALATLSAFACGGSTATPSEPPSGTGLQEGAPWPMFRHDLHHTGRSPAVGPSAPRIRWQFSPAAPDILSNHCPPAIAADGTIYIQSPTAVNALTAEGVLKWSFPFHDRCGGSPLIAADGTIYVSGSQLHALTPEGTERWHFQAMYDELGDSPAIASDGTIYVGSEAFGLHALAPDGSLRWTFPIQGGVKTSPAVAKDGTIYIGGGDRILALSPSGEKKWETPVDARHLIPIIAANGDIYAAAGETLVAFLPGGAPLWSVAVKNLATQFPPALTADGALWLLTWEGLFRYGPDGVEQQRLETYAQSMDMPLVDAKGVVYFAGSKGTIHAVDDSGREKWMLTLTPTSSFGGSPVMDAKGTLYFTGSGGLFAVGDAP